MSDTLLWLLTFGVAAPLDLFVCIVVFGDVAEGAAIFIVSMAVLLNWMDNHTELEVR